MTTVRGAMRLASQTCGRPRPPGGVPDTPTPDLVPQLWPTTTYRVRRSWFAPVIQAGRGKREPGETPGLPRSGEWERPPSPSTGSTGPGKRRPVGVETERSSRRAHESEDLPAHHTRRVRWSEAAWDGRRLVRRTPRLVLVPRRPPARPGPSRTDLARREHDGHRSTHPHPRHLDAGAQAQRRHRGPVDVNKIVRAVDRVAPTWTTSTRCGSPPAPSAACTTAPPPPSWTGCRSRPRRR